MKEMLQSFDLELNCVGRDNLQTKNKIVKLQQCEQRYKYYSDHINYAFSHPNQLEAIDIADLIENEELELDKFIKIWSILNNPDQRPYVRLIDHYKGNIQEHRLLLELFEEDQQKFLERARVSKQIDQLELEEYLESLSLKYSVIGAMALLGSFIIDLIIGASYRWNMVNIYITSYYKITTQPELLVTEDSIASPLSLFCMGIGMRAGLRVCEVLGVFPTLLLSMLLTSGAIYLSSYMPNFQTFIFFGFSLYPFLSCLSFQLIINQCCNYYRKYRLVITGFLLIGTGLGHVLFGMLNTECCNPNDLNTKYGYYGDELDFISRQVPSCMRQMSVVVLVAGTIAVALIYPAIRQNSLKNIQKQKKRRVVDFEHACASERQAFSSEIFWIMVAMIICTTSANYFLITNFKNLCAKYNSNSLSLASTMLGFNLGNALSRAFWDFLFPKIGFKWCLVIINSINAFNLGTIKFILHDNNLYSLYFVLGGVCLGGCMLCFLNFATIVFGQEVGQQLPGYIWTAYSLASLLQYAVFNSYDLHKSGYLPSCMVLCALNLVSLALVIRSRLQGNWQNSLHLLQLKCCFS